MTDTVGKEIQTTIKWLEDRALESTGETRKRLCSAATYLRILSVKSWMGDEFLQVGDLERREIVEDLRTLANRIDAREIFNQIRREVQKGG